MSCDKLGRVSSSSSMGGRLPLDIIVYGILPRLPPASLLRFKYVCKSWLKLISSPEFVDLHLCHSKSSGSCRLLSFREGRYLYSCDFDSQPGSFPIMHQYYLNTDCASNTTYVVGSCNGLVCIAGRTHHHQSIVTILNPCTGSKRDIPYGKKRQFTWGGTDIDMINYGFGFDDKSNEYKIMGVLVYSNKMQVKVLTLRGINTWREVSSISPMDDIQFGSGVAIDSHLHLLHWKFVGKFTQKPRVGCFDLRSEQWVDDVPLPTDIIDCQFGEFLVLAFEGRLCICISGFYKDHTWRRDYTDVWVMNKYRIQESWVKLFAIDSEVIPLASDRFSTKLLLRERDGYYRLAWYDTKNKTSKRVDMPGYPLQPFVCNGSLVTLPGSEIMTSNLPSDAVKIGLNITSIDDQDLVTR